MLTVPKSTSASEFEVRIDRKEIVLPANLQPMTGKKQEPGVGAREFLGETADPVAHPGVVEIKATDNVEAQTFERRGDIGCIVDRALEAAPVPVVGIPDDQRDPLVGRCWCGGKTVERNENQYHCKQAAHGSPHG